MVYNLILRCTARPANIFKFGTGGERVRSGCVYGMYLFDLETDDAMRIKNEKHSNE